MVIPHDILTCPTCNGSSTVARVSGAGIREIREASGQSLRHVARKIGVSPAYLSDMELGRRGMSEDVARRILEVCSK